MSTRISTTVFYNGSVSSMQDHLSSLSALTQKITTQQRFLASKEAPVDAVRARELANVLAARNQYSANQDKLEFALKSQDVILKEMQRSLTDVRSILSKVSPSLDPSERKQYGTEIADIYLNIKTLANSKDPAGRYIFAGFATDSEPFTHTPGDLQTLFNGDTNLRKVDVADGRQIALNEDISGVMDAEGANDLLAALDQIASAIQGTLTNPDLDNAAGVVQSAIESLQISQVNVSMRMVELNDARTVNTNLMNLDKSSLADLTQLDMTAAIVELQMRQTTLEAAQKSFSMTSSLTLFNQL